MDVYSTARIGAVRILSKSGVVLHESSAYEPTWSECQAGIKSADIRKAFDKLPPALRSLAEFADLVGEIKFGDPA